VWDRLHELLLAKLRAADQIDFSRAAVDSSSSRSVDKTELIHRRAPWKTKESFELATLEWVAWYKHHRLIEPLGYIPPAEAEANYCKQLRNSADVPVLT